MKPIKLSDINLHSIGNEIQISGVIWNGLGKTFITLVPDKEIDLSNLEIMPLTLPEWETLLKQTDLLETEMLAKDPTGKIVKIIYRKSQRQIDSYLQWACFKRDNYHCRYCYREAPLTCDHVDLYENGGATILENLVSACKSCNKDRGRTEYEDWVTSNIYVRKSINLPENIKQQNLELVNQLPHLKTLRVYHIKSR